MTLQSSNIYIFDTSSLIKLKEYPTDLFIGLRDRIESLIQQKRIISPKQVFDEIKRQDDEIKAFVEKYNNIMFVDTNNEDILREFAYISENYPNLIDHTKERECADPYVIALAKALINQHGGTLERFMSENKLSLEQVIVVTEDIRDKRKKRSIRSVCNEEGIRCITLIEFFREEGFRFTMQ